MEDQDEPVHPVKVGVEQGLHHGQRRASHRFQRPQEAGIGTTQGARRSASLARDAGTVARLRRCGGAEYARDEPNGRAVGAKLPPLACVAVGQELAERKASVGERRCRLGLGLCPAAAACRGWLSIFGSGFGFASRVKGRLFWALLAVEAAGSRGSHFMPERLQSVQGRAASHLSRPRRGQPSASGARGAGYVWIKFANTHAPTHPHTLSFCFRHLTQAVRTRDVGGGTWLAGVSDVDSVGGRPLVSSETGMSAHRIATCSQASRVRSSGECSVGGLAERDGRVNRPIAVGAKALPAVDLD